MSLLIEITVLCVVGQNILFLVKQVRTKKKKLIYYRIYDISKFKKVKTFLLSLLKMENFSVPPLLLFLF